MKILHTVESYLPSRHGMQEVVTQLSEGLVEVGHEVTIATSYHPGRETKSINGVEIAAFKIKGNAVLGMSGETNDYQDFLKTNNFDIVTNFAAQQWATDLALPILKDIASKKVFVPTGFSALNNPDFKQYFQNMANWMKSYDANVFLADHYRDINFARENAISGIHIIPNGASETEFENTPYINIREMLNVSQETKLILTVGNHTGYKGHQEAMKIFSKAKIENAVLLIVGKSTSHDLSIVHSAKGMINLLGLKETNCSIKCHVNAALFNKVSNSRSIFVKELDRLSTVNAFRQADLFLFPSLIECSPIVLFEALAASTPFLVSEVGNSKEIIEWTNGGKLLPTTLDRSGYSRVNIRGSAQMLKDLIYDKEALNSFATLGNKAFRDKFTWSKIVRQYEELYLKLLN